MVTVAHGRVHPRTADNITHCVGLPPNLARVELLKVVPTFEDLVLPDPPEEGYEKLGQCIGFVLRWPKDAIKVLETSTRSTSSPKYGNTPPARPSPLGLCPPLSYRDLAASQDQELPAAPENDFLPKIHLRNRMTSKHRRSYLLPHSWAQHVMPWASRRRLYRWNHNTPGKERDRLQQVVPLHFMSRS